MSGPRHQPGSSSITRPEYWWYAARAELLRGALGDLLGSPELVLDVGSADGPSVGWMRGRRTISLDTDPRGLVAGSGVCGSALALPFANGTFDVVAAFDVIEHCEPEADAIAELFRVLRPGGRLLASVPAYSWAWTDHDERAGHYRRYTRSRLTTAVRRAGFEVLRCTHGFAGVFPAFAAERAARRLRPPSNPSLPDVNPRLDRAFRAVSAREARWLRNHDVPFGSSIFLAAQRPG